MPNSAFVVIPARLQSTRLPRKPLLPLRGRPLVLWVAEAVSRAKRVSGFAVATDSEEIASVVKKAGFDAVMTSPELPSGTDRVAAVARSRTESIVVNVQGDEPLMEPEVIDAAIDQVAVYGHAIGTASSPFQEVTELQDMAAVKVLCDINRRAIYFSRFAIPYTRISAPSDPKLLLCERHLGLYAFKRETLLNFAKLPPSDLEKAESLEQLRALYHGLSIGVASVVSRSFGIDTLDDVARFEKVLGS